jgi:hypothetical protein
MHRTRLARSSKDGAHRTTERGQYDHVPHACLHSGRLDLDHFLRRTIQPPATYFVVLFFTTGPAFVPSHRRSHPVALYLHLHRHHATSQLPKVSSA